MPTWPACSTLSSNCSSGFGRERPICPPPRKHRHRYHGVFAPNHKLRPAVTALNRSNRRQCRPPAGRPPTGASSCRSTTTGQSFKRQPTSCPRSTSTSSERYRTQAADAPGTANWDAVCDEARKTPPQGDARRCGEPPPDGRHAQSRPSRTVRQPEDRRGSAIDRAIPKMVARYRRMPAGATKAPQVGTVLFAVFPEDMAVSP